MTIVQPGSDRRQRHAIADVAERIRKAPERVPTPIAYRPADAAFVLGVCRATIYDMVAEGRLEARKLGTATVIPHESLIRALEAAPLADATKRAQASIAVRIRETSERAHG